MFGFQRVSDLCEQQEIPKQRFLIGATAGRTTAGGGLQHQDGHTGHILASTIPNCIGATRHILWSLAVSQGRHAPHVPRNGLCFYYITTMNKNYSNLKYPKRH